MDCKVCKVQTDFCSTTLLRVLTSFKWSSFWLWNFDRVWFKDKKHLISTIKRCCVIFIRKYKEALVLTRTILEILDSHHILLWIQGLLGLGCVLLPHFPPLIFDLVVLDPGAGSHWGRSSHSLLPEISRSPNSGPSTPFSHAEDEWDPNFLLPVPLCHLSPPPNWAPSVRIFTIMSPISSRALWEEQQKIAGCFSKRKLVVHLLRETKIRDEAESCGTKTGTLLLLKEAKLALM